MQITTGESGHILKISGSVEITGAKELQDGLRDFIDGTSRAILDLSEVDSCDTAFLQLLCSARKTAERSGKQFELSGLSAAVRDASATLGLSLTEAPEENRLTTPDDVAGPTPAKQGGEDAI